MYQFQKINDDEYKLISNDKEFTFTRTVDMVKEMQSVDLITTIKVAEILAERGETYENTKLRVEYKEGNNTVIDESNLRRLEEKAKDLATQEVLEKMYLKLFNKKPMELIKEIGIDIQDTESIKNFSSEVTKILVNGLDEDTPISQDA